MKYHSHPATRQDEWVLSKSRGPGNYCEIGAFDGVTHSNTLALEEQGWTGLLIEPNPEQFAECVANRPRSDHRCIAVHPDGGKQAMYVGGQYSGLLDTMSEPWIQEHQFRKNPIIAVDALPLDAIIGDCHLIDYLSIDTEGGEYEILHDWFACKRRPAIFRLITVEFRYDGRLADKLVALLSHQYNLDQVRGFDLCFERKQ